MADGEMMAARSFRDEDEEAQYCLSTLRDGTREEKIVARERLAAIFARRHLFEEAAELYELNVRAGVRSPELFERLSETYRQLGDHASADAALIEADRWRPQPSAIPAPVASDPPAPEPRVVPFPDPLAIRPAEPPPPRPVTSPAEAARPANRAAPGPLRVVGIVLFLIVLPVALLALFVVNPLDLYLEGRPAGPTIQAGTDAPPEVKIAPDMSSTWYLRAGRSVSGHWATSGLDLTLNQELDGVGDTITVTDPRTQSWGETITIVERRGQDRANQETVVLATFEAPPDLPPPGTVVDGRIAGEITAPRLTESLQFNTVTENVDLPIRLVVVTPFELWMDRLGNAVTMFFEEDRWLLLTIGAVLTWCVLAGGVAILARVRRS